MYTTAYGTGRQPQRRASLHKGPVMCLTTMYKTLTGILAKIISTHLEEQSLLLAEPEGCHPRNKGCKDQLMISKAIYEDCRRRNKNISISLD